MKKERFSNPQGRQLSVTELSVMAPKAPMSVPDTVTFRRKTPSREATDRMNTLAMTDQSIVAEAVPAEDCKCNGRGQHQPCPCRQIVCIIARRCHGTHSLGSTIWLQNKSYDYGSSPPMFQEMSSETLQTLRDIGSRPSRFMQVDAPPLIFHAIPSNRSSVCMRPYHAAKHP